MPAARFSTAAAQRMDAPTSHAPGILEFAVKRTDVPLLHYMERMRRRGASPSGPR